MSKLRLLHALLLAALLGIATSVGAQSAPDILPLPICEGPISTCGFEVVDALSSVEARDTCPTGFSCTCVPSCPECDDCDAQVCVRDAQRECRTACDCAPGLGCFDGQCIAGFAPVYCCDSDICPVGDQCQHRDGRPERCEEDPMDQSCRERVAKVAKVIGKRVERGSYCRENSDCVQVGTSTECRGTCGEMVNKRVARKIQRQVRRLNHKVCADFQRDGCPFATPSCHVVQPACVENRCVGVPRLPGPPRPQPPIIDSRETLGDVNVSRELQAAP